MPSYDISKKEFGSEDGVISVNPHWILAVVRFKQPLTFSRDKLFSGEQAVSFDSDSETITAVREVMVIDSDCVSLSINQTKSSYVSSMNASLMEGRNYLSEVLPTDWIMAWIVNSPEKAKDIVDRLNQQEACNAYGDGLKFVGRVQSVRKTLQQTPNGIRIVRYQIQALGGKEFDSMIFYDQHLAEQETSIGQFLAKLNVGISDIFNTAAEKAQGGKGGIDSNKAIPTLLKLLLGDGVPPRSAAPGGLQVATGLTATKEAPYALAVPKEVGSILSKKDTSKEGGNLSYADVFELLIGVQKYSDGENKPAAFTPQGVPTVAEIEATPESIRSPTLNSSRRTTSFPLKGEFLPTPIPLSNRTVWSILEQFLNPAINEMYYVLRANPEGFVVPTLVVRQLPFSTASAVNKLGSEVTGFMELPRWKIHPILIRDLDIGRSDATHFNFIHVYGQASAAIGSQSLTQQIIRNPPIRDEQDIKRNGIRPHMQTVACSIQDTFTGPRKWMEIVADFLIGQHLTLNGTCTMQGVESPICPGDNVEIDDVVYHLEAVSHTCSLTPNGTKSYLTSLALTHGVRSDQAVAQKQVPENKTVPVKSKEPSFSIENFGASSFATTTVKDSPLLYNVPKTEITVAGDQNLNPDLFIYSGITPDDNVTLDPGLSIEE